MVRNLTKELLLPSNFLRILGTISRIKAFTGPLKVNTDITNKCDMRCVMCWYHSPYLKGPSITKQLPLEKFKDLVLQLKSINTKIIFICGEGEPLLHPNISEMIEFTRRNGLKIEIMTNGYYLDKQLTRLIKDTKVKKILLSLHSADEETFQAIRPEKTADDFRKIIDNLYYLRDLKGGSLYPQIFMINVISALNYNNTLRMAQLAKKLRANKILFKPFFPSPGFPSSLDMNFEQKYTLSQDLRNILKNLDIPNNISDYLKVLNKKCLNPAARINSSIQNKNNRSINLCYIPYVQSVIDLEGNVIGCVYARRILLGNIYERSFKDIWYGKTYKDFRKGTYCPRRCTAKAVYPLLI